MRTYSLPYGDSQVEFTLPEGSEAHCIEPNKVQTLKNIRSEVSKSLYKLNGIIKPSRRVAIIVDDITRPTPTAEILPSLLDYLNSKGVRDDLISLIVALGTHRPMTPKELMVKYGEALDRVNLIQPDFRDPEKQVRVGVMPGGAPIEVNKEISKVDMAIGVGMVTPHHVSGFSGGSKIVLPGISGERTVGEMHLLSARLRRSFLGIEKNEVRDLMDLVANRAGLRGLVELAVDGRGEPTWVGAGYVGEVFKEGVREAKRVYEVESPGALDFVIASSYPADLEFWQAHKSLYPADMVLRDGGTLILLTPCPEGVAKTHPEVVELAGLPPEEIDKRVREGLVRDPVGAANSIVWSKIRSRIKIVVVSDGISENEAKSMGFGWYGDLQEAINSEMKGLHRPRVGIMRNAPELLPKVR